MRAAVTESASLLTSYCPASWAVCLGNGGVTEASLYGPHAVTAAPVGVCRVGLAEAKLLFNFHRISLERFTTGDTWVMFVLEVPAALEGSEV